MAAIYYLSINDARPASVESLGIQIHSKTLINQGMDVVAMTWAAKPSAAPLIKTRDKVVIYKDNARWFTGWAASPTKGCSGDKYGIHYRIEGPWRKMSEAVYRVSNNTPGPPWWASAGNTTPLPPFPNSSQAWDVLKVFADPALKGLCTVSPWPASLLPVVYDNYPFDNNPVGECCCTLLRWQILAGTRFDYAQAVPVMQITNRLDDVQTLPMGDKGVSDVILTFRDDLWPLGIECRTIDSSAGTPTIPNFTNPTFFDDSQIFPAGLVRGAPGNMPICSYTDVQGNMAQLIYNLMRQPVWEGTITVQGYGETTVRPGTTLSLAGLTDLCDPAWGTMGAIVQQVAYDPLNDRTTITTGAKSTETADNAAEFIQDLFRLHPTRTVFDWWRFAPVGSSS